VEQILIQAIYMAKKVEKYYRLTGRNPQQVAIAFAENRKYDTEIIAELEGKNKLPFEFQLKKSTKGKKELKISDDLAGLERVWEDYQLNNFAWNLVSSNFKDLICNHLTGNENIDWIKAVVNANEEQRDYYIPRFGKMLDVLDIEKTISINGPNAIVYPVFSLSKVKNYTIFNKPSSFDFWKVPTSLFVNEGLRRAIIEAKLTGVKFEKVSAV
jgi:hypothetical protein